MNEHPKNICEAEVVTKPTQPMGWPDAFTILYPTHTKLAQLMGADPF